MTTFTNSEIANDLKRKLAFLFLMINLKKTYEFSEIYENNNSINDDVIHYNLEEKYLERTYNHLKKKI
ncbi:hypothetical protein BCR32DRAFT_276662 [Anaeromyces robustus]|uniref:Uncharacterized protein n=1 Tax=Anaeromyces robustus TaxID=1754192 RepID=A0A1Y1XGZ1_9FUNG|nr:hypothetical protein BCR32DRAFT_276662 [Anaeromyces robustus]|eukprot:ORX85031.1 hypothetical protein BCR32DRAFT_276662 [Anaeromyces robustus]